MIIPKKKRILVYSVLENKIINDKHKEQFSNAFNVDTSEIAKKRNECVLYMSDENNLLSFVYVHKNGNIEIEMNVKQPKYEFHVDYEKASLN